MSSYIEREEFLERFSNMSEISHDILVDIVNHIPNADVSEIKIVWCKDCKHWMPDVGATMFCENTGITTRDYDYCSFGEMSE